MILVTKSEIDIAPDGSGYSFKAGETVGEFRTWKQFTAFIDAQRNVRGLAAFSGSASTTRAAKDYIDAKLKAQSIFNKVRRVFA